MLPQSKAKAPSARRDFLQRALMLPLAMSIPSLGAAQQKSTPRMERRTIPSTGEPLPVVGCGTWRTFDVGDDPNGQARLAEVLKVLFAAGGSAIDSSPMYGSSEAVAGTLLTRLDAHNKAFVATKVWTQGKAAGIAQMEESMRRLQQPKIDLMQVHNLVDVNTQLATLQEWKQQGRIRYTGITHYESGALSDIEKLIRSQKFDFLQINYSLMEPEAEKRVLPLAQEHGVAVIANRPLGAGDLFGKVRSKPLPDWAAEFDCHSWAQFFLKWIVANPAITCAIPATDKLRHLEDNMLGGVGPLPDAKLRPRMAEFVSSL